MPIVGVDSAGTITSRRVERVEESLGRVAFWGRYLLTKQGSADAFTRGEVRCLPPSWNCKILPVYNGAERETCALGIDQGQKEAGAATAALAKLYAPNDLSIAIYADIESGWPLSSGWLDGWSAELLSSGYKPGLYCAPEDGLPARAFFGASTKTRDNLIVWSAQKSQHPKTQQAYREYCLANAVPPDFTRCDDLLGPAGESKTPDLWQYVMDCYGSDGGSPEINYDADLSTNAAYDLMWQVT